jgi:hypothetical protein
LHLSTISRKPRRPDDADAAARHLRLPWRLDRRRCRRTGFASERLSPWARERLGSIFDIASAAKIAPTYSVRRGRHPLLEPPGPGEPDGDGETSVDDGSRFRHGTRRNPSHEMRRGARRVQGRPTAGTVEPAAIDGPGGVNAPFGDGSVKLLEENVNLVVQRSSITPYQAEVICSDAD